VDWCCRRCVVGCGSYDDVRGLVVGVTVDRLLLGGLNPTANSNNAISYQFHLISQRTRKL